MILDNFMVSTMDFLELFNLKFENKNSRKLSVLFDKNKKLAIYDIYGNLVGNIKQDYNFYRINVMEEDKILTATAYKDGNHESGFIYKYTVDLIESPLKLEGTYKSIKNNSRVIKQNEHYVHSGKTFILKCNFNTEKKEYYLFFEDGSQRVKIYYTYNKFSINSKMKGNPYELIIRRFPKHVYYEKTFPFVNEKTALEDATEYHRDIFGGEEVDWNTSSFAKKVVSVLENISEDYFDLLDVFKEKTNVFSNNLFDNIINKTIYEEKELDERKMFKRKQVQAPQKKKSKKKNHHEKKKKD